MSSSLPASMSPIVADHLQPYQVPPSSFAEFFTCGSDSKTKSRLVASAVVLHSNHVLLLQRAAHNFQPMLWEIPGGRCESRDESVITSAVRELWEESGIVAKQVVDVVGEYEWLDHGERWKKITFLVKVEPKDGGDLENTEQPRVVIDPNEQADFIWATKEDVMADRRGGVVLNWTSQEQKQMVLKAFSLTESR